MVPAAQNIAKGSSFDTDAPLDAQGGYGRNQQGPPGNGRKIRGAICPKIRSAVPPVPLALLHAPTRSAHVGTLGTELGLAGPRWLSPLDNQR